MSNTAPAKQVRKPKKLPFVIMCILSAIVAVLNVLLCVLVPKYYTTINSFLYKEWMRMRWLLTVRLLRI